MAQAKLSELRTRLELILSLPSDDSYVNSTTELQDLNAGYEKTAYAYNWKQFLLRTGIPIVSNVDRYALPARFRKADMIKVQGVDFNETELITLKNSRRKFVVDRNTKQIILSNVPSTASTAFVLTNSPSASQTASLNVSSTTGLASFDEIWISSVSGTSEMSLVSSLTTTVVTANLAFAKSLGDTFYRQKEIIDMFYYQYITYLAGVNDTMLVPDDLDFAVCHYAAYLAYLRLEDYNKANQNLQAWDDQVKRAYLADINNSTGGDQMTIA